MQLLTRSIQKWPSRQLLPYLCDHLLHIDQRQNIGEYVTVHLSTTKLQEDPMSTAEAFYLKLDSPVARKRAIELLGALQYIPNTPAAQIIPADWRNFIWTNSILQKVLASKPPSRFWILAIGNLGSSKLGGSTTFTLAVAMRRLALYSTSGLLCLLVAWWFLLVLRVQDTWTLQKYADCWTNSIRPWPR